MIEIFQVHPQIASFDSDIEWLVRHYQKGLAEELTHAWTKKYRSVDLQKTNEVHQLLTNLMSLEDQVHLLIAKEGSRRIGYFLGTIKDCVGEKPGKIGSVSGLYVVLEMRKKGIGQQLFDRGLEWFQSKKLTLSDLYVAAENEAAKKFWEKNGFKISEVVMTRYILKK